MRSLAHFPPSRSLYCPVSLLELGDAHHSSYHGEAESKVALACPCPASPVEVSLSLPEDVEIIHYPAVPSCTAAVLSEGENTEDCQPPC